jgi:hypothetical protein
MLKEDFYRRLNTTYIFRIDVWSINISGEKVFEPRYSGVVDTYNEAKSWINECLSDPDNEELKFDIYKVPIDYLSKNAYLLESFEGDGYGFPDGGNITMRTMGNRKRR